MLILARRAGQSIVLTCKCGERIELVVHAVENKAVKLGIKADPAVTAYRDEIQKEIDQGIRRKPEVA